MATTTTAQEELSSLIMRATNPLNNDDDPNLVQAVCQEVGNDMGKIQVAVRLIIHKMQSPHEREAMQALLVLQACINNCGPNFHSEVGKFRFLNEMIKLVSPKYSGNQTPNEVKKRVIDLLYTWTMDLKTESKISEAFEMLKKQGVLKEEPNYLGAQIHPPAKVQQPASFEDEKKSRLLQRLLQSKRPEDIIKANALIKHMVKEDERRVERSSRRSVEVETAQNNVKVLDEMLTQYKKSNSSSQADLDLMEELFTSCQTLRTNIYRIVAEMEDKEDGMGELLRASDDLSRVMGRYKLETGSKLQHSKEETKSPPKTSTNVESKVVEEDSLLDLSPVSQPLKTESQVLDELGLSDLQLNNVTESHLKKETQDVAPLTTNLVPKESILDALGDVFSNGDILSQSGMSFSNTESSNTLNHDMPQPLSPKKKKQPILASDKCQLEKEPPKLLNDLDLLGSSLLRESLPTHVDPIGSHFKAQEKVSLNEMKQKSFSKAGSCPPESTSRKDASPHVTLEDNSSSTFEMSFGKALLDGLLPLGGNSPKEGEDNHSPYDSLTSISSADSSKLLGDLTPPPSALPGVSPTPPSEVPKPKPNPNVQLCEVKPLTNIHVTLEDIKPGKQSSLPLINSNGVSVVLHFTDNKPREDVSIIVVSVTSTNAKSISNYVLQAVGPKGCKVRLQPPSSSCLAEYSPFLPPPAITQIMLIANPNQLNVSLKVMLSYTIDDEPMTDMGEVERLPL